MKIFTKNRSLIHIHTTNPGIAELHLTVKKRNPLQWKTQRKPNSFDSYSTSQRKLIFENQRSWNYRIINMILIIRCHLVFPIQYIMAGRSNK